MDRVLENKEVHMLKPLSQRVVLQKIKEEEKAAGGLLIAGQSKTPQNVASVVAVAADVDVVAVGQTVVFEVDAALAVTHEGGDYFIVNLENIVAIVE